MGRCQPGGLLGGEGGSVSILPPRPVGHEARGPGSPVFPELPAGSPEGPHRKGAGGPGLRAPVCADRVAPADAELKAGDGGAVGTTCDPAEGRDVRLGNQTAGRELPVEIPSQCRPQQDLRTKRNAPSGRGSLRQVKGN